MEYLSPEAPPQAPSAESQTGKWVGIASIIVGAVSMVAIVGVFILATAIAIGQPAWQADSTSPRRINIGLVILCTAPLTLVGLIFGGLGAFLDRRRIWLGLIGLALNGCYLAAFGLIMYLGFSNQ
jgi:hypothetical protein